jgi:hypothetical protein
MRFSAGHFLGALDSCSTPPQRESPPRYHLTTHLLVCYNPHERNEQPQEPQGMLGLPAKSVTPTKNPQIPTSISNRESLRLETGVTQTKQTPTPISNREAEPLFTTPFHKSISAPRPIAPSNSNRESLRLETGVTQTKQTMTDHSNREAEPLFTSLSTRLVSPGIAMSRNRSQGEALHKARSRS